MSAAFAGAVLAAIGVAFVVVAGIGVVRLPDPFQRLHAATKAGTLGSALVLLGASLALRSGGAALTAGMTILVVVVTLPLAAQLLGRAAYMSGATLKGLSADDPLTGVLDRDADPLAPEPPLPAPDQPEPRSR